MPDNQTIVGIIIKAVDETKTALNSSVTNLKSIGKAAEALEGPVLAAGAALATALGVAVGKTIETAEAFEDLKDKTGISVEGLSTLSFAAKQYNVDQESLNTGLVRLAYGMEQAKNGSALFSDTFQALGIQVTNSNGALKPTQDILLALSNKFKSMPDGTEKAAVAMQIFGRSGADLIPLLDRGASGIQALQAKAQSLGLEISGNTAEQAEQFTQNLKELEGAADGMVRQITAELLPTLLDLSGSFIKSYQEGGTVRQVLEGIVVTVKGAATFFEFLADTVTFAFQHVANEIAGVASVIAAFFEGGFKQAGAAAKAAMAQEQSEFTTYTTKVKALAYGTSNELSKIPYKAGPDKKDANLAINTWQSIQKKAKDYLNLESTDAKNFTKELQSLNTEANAGILQLATTTAKAFETSISQSITQVVDGSKSASQAIADVGKALIDAVVGFMAQKAAAFIAEQALAIAGNAILGEATAANILAATAITNAYTPAAAAVSLATFGANAGPAIAALTTTFGVAKGLTVSAGPGLATGTNYLSQTGIVLAHQGERIVPQKTNQDLTKYLKNSSHNDGGGIMQANLYIDGQKMGNAITKWLRNGQIDLAVS